MMDNSGSTTQRAEAGLFGATHWSVVKDAKNGSDPALASLCENYRGPLIAWLCARGCSRHDAEDHVQGFMARMLKRDFLENVAPEKGRFRTFLLTCLKRFCWDEQARANAAKRGGGRFVRSLQAEDEEGRLLFDPAGREPGPDLEFDRAWARTILANSLKRLEKECAAQGHSALCAALQPMLLDQDENQSYRAVGARLNMTEAATKMAAHRIRARLKFLIRDEVLQTVSGEQDWEQEVRYLIQLFA
jgi:RNA polymerase sigma-70 factor (ECF subfamily)